MKEKIFAWIEEQKLIRQGDFVLAGISGGADSVCLLLLLLEYQKSCDFSLEAVHIEHGIRGKASREDAKFTEAFCKEHGVVCKTYAVDVPAYAREHRMGIEEAARRLRYECFAHAARAHTRTDKKLALAHHADDNAETLLLWLARGSGVRGLGGIRASREAEGGLTLIRPLLCATREEIEAYLGERHIGFRMDETNEDTAYSRNCIRHEILPQLAKVNRKASVHLAQAAMQLAGLSEYLDKEAERIERETCIWREGGCVIGCVLFEEYPAVLRQTVLHHAIEKAAGSSRDIGSVHVKAVEKLWGLQAGRRASLPYGLFAERVYEGVVLSKEKEERQEQSVFRIACRNLEELAAGEWYVLDLSDGSLRMRIRNFQAEIEKIHKKTYTKLLDYDKIKGSMQFRKRAAGDYLTIDGEGHRKKLKEYFIDQKLARSRRDEIWLLTEGAHVLWVVGGRISADCRIGPNTKRILEVQISGGSYCEDQEYSGISDRGTDWKQNQGARSYDQ